MIPAVQNAEELRSILQAAERAQAAGRHEEVGRLLARARQIAPDHPLVLNAEGIREIHSGNHAAARRLIERAIEKDAGNPSFWVNLGTALHGLGLYDEEMKALERALAIEPRHLLALLQKASLLERMGKPRSAAIVYGNALQTLPRKAQLPPSLRGPIQRATEVVRANGAELAAHLEARLHELRSQHAGTDLSRFDHCLDVLLGRRRIYHPQPTFMYFPKLPEWEFYPRELFPWLGEVEAATPDIRAELEAVLAERPGDLVPYIAYPEGVPLDQWAELNHSRRWSVYFLWRYGQAIGEHLERCPRTAALLERIPRLDVPGHGPTAFFSILDAKSHIPPHTGVTNTRVIVHVPLVVPEGCRFRVGSETRVWRPGTAWVFDDSIEHEAWNDSDVPRAILIFDVWNPYLSAAERDLVRLAVQEVGEFYCDGESPLAGRL